MGRKNQHDTWRNKCRVSNAGATGATRAGVLVRLMWSGRPAEHLGGQCRLWGREIQVRAEPVQALSQDHWVHSRDQVAGVAADASGGKTTVPVTGTRNRN